MADLLLKTKLCVPIVRNDLVARPRLTEKLNTGFQSANGFSRKLTLVSAPAGYGKTTLVADWLASTGLPSVWLSLDDGDNDPARFLAYLLAALHQVDARIGLTARGMLQSPQPPPQEVLLTTLINDLLEIPGPFSLALDDYHTIQNPVIHRQLGFLLDHQPQHMHLAILTREDPLLPVARLRSLHQVCDIRQEDLRFSPAETARFFQQAIGLDLPQEHLETVQDRIEGWAAGLQLAALSMQTSPDLQQFIQSLAISNRYILDYLFEEIFARQPVDMQDFLMKTSVLERLSAILCQAVTDQVDSQQRLQAFEKGNLFIVPLDPAREWYRYHHLFRDLLRHQLHLNKSIQEEDLHQRASAWYQSQGVLADAIQHSLAARDWEKAGHLIINLSEQMLKNAEITTLIGWYGRMPQEEIHAQPLLCITFAWALLLAGQLDRAGPLLDHVEKLAPPGSAFMGQIAAAQAYLARTLGDYPRLIQKSELALSLLPEQELISRGNVAMNLGLAYWHAGRLDDTEKVLQEAQAIAGRAGNTYALLTSQVFLARTLASRGMLRLAASSYQALLKDGGQNPILALAHYDLSLIYYEWNQLQQASEHLERGLEISLRSGNAEFQNSGHLQRVFLCLAQADRHGAIQAIQQSHSLEGAFSAATRARIAACHVQLALALDDDGTAAHWAGELMDGVDAHSFYRFMGLTHQRVLISVGEKKTAAEQLKTGYEIARRGGWGYALVAVRILQALAATTTDSALEYLADALRTAHPERFVRAFADAGAPLAPLLQKAAQRGIMPEYIGQILGAFPGAASGSAALDRGSEKIAPDHAALVEPLSQREIEVLRLVAAGLSNREIAGRLVISPGTAKTHIHHLCGKLGVRNRTEAAMRARELHLV